MLKTNLFLARPRMIITMISSMILACGREDRAATSDDSTGSDASAKYDGNDAALGCERPLSRCKDACVQTWSDASNCGACGNICASDFVCSRGSCRRTCDSGLTDCDSSCVNLQTDPSHCGSCKMACQFAQATAACQDAICVLDACDGGYADCNNDSADGCEIALSSAQDCGACGNICATPTRGTIECVSAGKEFTCSIASCDGGYGDCDADYSNGCETYTRNNVNHCGACGNVCSYANASAICTSGACAMSACNSGFRNCDSNPANGCETITSSDVTNCGSCGRACSVTNGTAGCVAGSCTVSACNSGYGDCDGAAWNGCETNLDTSVNHCGACGNACPSRANASRSCTDGSCGSTCTTGYADCDNDPANGCETYTRYNVNHCGACGNVCPSVANSSPQCADSTCGFGCTGPYQDCDNAPANGCESNRQTDSNNCGRCGTTCAAGQACYRSSCEPLGYAFGANKTQGCSATLRSSCGTNMADFSEHNMVTSATVQECLAFPNLPNGARVRVSFDYGAAASSCWSSPRLTIFSNDIWRSWIAWFSFPGCTSAGSAWLDFTLPADQNTFLLEMYSGDWCSSVRVTNITQL